MLKNFMKSAAIASGVLLGATGAHAATTVDIEPDGIVFNEIEVVSENGTSWTKIQSSDLNFPVSVALGISSGQLYHYSVKQYEEVLFFSGYYLNPEPHYQGNLPLTGSTDHLNGIMRKVILDGCNAKLNVGDGINQEHTFGADVEVSLHAQFNMTNGDPYPSYQDHASFPVTVKCKPVALTEEITAQAPDIVKVDLGLSSAGPVSHGTLKYSGSCPMGITLNMYWETNPAGEIKSYVQHKDVAGAHNWTSTVFPVTTNVPLGNGNVKKEMTDLIAIPFAGSMPVGGGQVAVGGASNALQVGGSGGGGGAIDGVAATNTGTNSGAQKYVGYFRLVAFKESQTAPAFGFDGSVSSTKLQIGKKYSPWRKYEVTCEPKQSTVALDSPDGIQNAPNSGTFNPDDAPSFPQPDPVVDTAFDPATRDLTLPPTHTPKPGNGIIRTNPKTKADNVPDRIKALAAEARRKQAAKKMQGEIKRVNSATVNAQQLKLNAEAARRAALAKAKKAQADRRAALAKAAAEARRRAALKAQQEAHRRAVAAALAAQKKTRAAKRRTSSAKSFSRSRVMRLR